MKAENGEGKSEKNDDKMVRRSEDSPSVTWRQESGKADSIISTEQAE